MKMSLMTACCAVFLSLVAKAQTPENNYAYAITSQQKGAYEWTEVKRIDLSNGTVVQNVFENSNVKYNVFDARSLKEIKVKAGNGAVVDDNQPFSGLSAACAYDKKLNRLYYAPMFINQLRYIDLNAANTKVYIFSQETLSSAENLDAEANHMTRMVIASDGNGYALNNEATHLVKFTTDEMPVITDLGALQNSAKNGEMSVADANTSWGGDLVADASGNLYLISAHSEVFKIDVQTRVATHLGKIKDLPEGFTTNGAAVDKDGQIILTSANFVTAYYKVDPTTWTSTILPNNDQVFNTSDLANENLLFKTSLTDATPAVTLDEKISIFPNPVKSNMFRVTFQNKEQGMYNVQLVDIAGRIISDRSVNVAGSGQVSEVKVDPSMARGMYMVKVLNNTRKEIFAKKVLIN